MPRQVTFLGATLCGHCTVAGSTGPADAFISLKHVSYFELDAHAPPPRALPATCTPLAGPPPFCTNGTAAAAAGAAVAQAAQ